MLASASGDGCMMDTMCFVIFHQSSIQITGEERANVPFG